MQSFHERAVPPSSQHPSTGRCYVHQTGCVTDVHFSPGSCLTGLLCTLSFLESGKLSNTFLVSSFFASVYELTCIGLLPYTKNSDAGGYFLMEIKTLETLNDPQNKTEPRSGRAPSLQSICFPFQHTAISRTEMFPSGKKNCSNQRCFYINVEKNHSQHFNGRLGKKHFFPETFPKFC